MRGQSKSSSGRLRTSLYEFLGIDPERELKDREGLVSKCVEF
jgi:hypothetical protein